MDIQLFQKQDIMKKMYLMQEIQLANIIASA